MRLCTISAANVPLVREVHSLEVMISELTRVVAFRVVTRTALTNELVLEPFHARKELINGISMPWDIFFYLYGKTN